MENDDSKEKWYKNKKILGGVIAVIVVVCLGIVYALTSQQTFVVKAQEIEVGEKVALTIDSLLNTDEMAPGIVDNLEITSNLMTDTEKYTYNEETGEVVSKDKDYLKVGTYAVTVKSGNDSQNIEIKIEDTKAPEFVGFRKTIVVEENAEEFDLSRYYLAEDKSDVSIETEEKTDISKATTIENTIVGTDEFDNFTEKECTVKIITQEDIKNGTKLTPMVDGNVPLSKDTMEKAKSGEIDVQVEDMDEDLQKAYQDIEENKIKGTTSYKKVEDTDAYFNREKFTNEGGISMEALGMTYQEYREFINKNFVDPETGTIKGTYNPETNAMEWTDESGSHSVSLDDVGIHREELGDSYWDWVDSQVNGGNNSSNSNNGGSSSGTLSNPGSSTGNTGGGSSTPSQPVEPETPPACDNTIPAGFFATRAEADAYGQQLVMDALLNGNANFGGYYVDIYTNGCGITYYGVTLKPFQ